MKIGVVSGSFDPFTLGHAWLVKKACEVFDKVIIVVSVNAGKTPMLSPQERKALALATMKTYLCWNERDFNEYLPKISIEFSNQKYLVSQAAELKATHIVRGIRSIKDFEYEKEILAVNRLINPFIETTYFIAPENIAVISSSMVKSLIGFDGWEYVVEGMVGTEVLEFLKKQYGETRVTA